MLSTALLICSIVIFFIYDRVVGITSFTGEVSEKQRASWAQGFRLVALIGMGRLCAPFVRRPNRVQEESGRVRVFSPLGFFTIAILIVLVVPVLSVIPYAFTKSDFIAFSPKLFSMLYFGTFAGSLVWRSAVIRSFEVGFGTAVLSVVLGFGATLTMTRMSRRATKPLFALLIVPRIVVAVGLLYLLGRFGLTGTNTGLIIGHTVLAIPYVVVPLAAGFQNFDWRLDDAACVMGASPWRRIRTVLLPLLLPLLMASVTAAFLFAFLVSFDDLTIAIFVSGRINTTLTKQMWDDIQLAVTPTLVAVSTTLVVLIALMIAVSSSIKRRAR